MRCTLLWILALLLFGCQTDRVSTYPVRGRVQYTDGTPVRVGTIELESVTFGTTASGRIQQDGSFVLGTYTSSDGAASGKHRVVVVQIIVSDGTVQHTKDHGRPVPRRYGDYARSSLSVSVEPQPLNDLIIELSGD
ncbi:MAG: carboxypeptidase regulatory-like domain-containing protein [Fuerstiella sp.]|nr:carboxypeptidase regulatory-like domain-containing protein [Fuerstiella sp.]